MALYGEAMILVVFHLTAPFHRAVWLPIMDASREPLPVLQILGLYYVKGIRKLAHECIEAWVVSAHALFDSVQLTPCSLFSSFWLSHLQPHKLTPLHDKAGHRNANTWHTSGNWILWECCGNIPILDQCFPITQRHSIQVCESGTLPPFVSVSGSFISASPKPIPALPLHSFGSISCGCHPSQKVALFNACALDRSVCHHRNSRHCRPSCK